MLLLLLLLLLRNRTHTKELVDRFCSHFDYNQTIDLFQTHQLSFILKSVLSDVHRVFLCNVGLWEKRISCWFALFWSLHMESG